MGATGFTHEASYEGATNSWITPRKLIAQFDTLVAGGRFFQLDPCACLTQPWPCAGKSFTERDDGLVQPWAGRIWLNPPYGPHTRKWVRRLAQHRNGVALIFARTDTQLWQSCIFPTASAYLFIAGRLTFARPDGTDAGSAGAPSALIAWGKECADALAELSSGAMIAGAFFRRAATCADLFSEDKE